MSEIRTENHFLEINGAPLYYEVAGTGHPLVLIHAGIADSRMWDTQFAVLARQYRVVRYDWRGYGKSAVPAVPFALHEELAKLLKHLEIARAHLIGLSFGSRLALDFALSHPEMVEKLVLAAPGVSGARPSPEQSQYNEDEDAALQAGDFTRATEITLRMWVDGPRRTADQVDPTVREQVRLMQRQAYDIPWPTGAQSLELEPAASGRLHEIQAPTLLLVGAYDLQPKIEQARWMASEIPGAQLVVIPEVAHMLNMEKPAEFNQRVLEFLSH